MDNTTKVAVAVRIRPLNENELSLDDKEGFENARIECINANPAQKQIVAGI